MGGFITKVAIGAVAFAVGMEYARRHPESPWTDLFTWANKGRNSLMKRLEAAEAELNDEELAA